MKATPDNTIIIQPIHLIHGMGMYQRPVQIVPEVAEVAPENVYVNIQNAYDSRFYEADGVDIMSYKEPTIEKGE